MAQLFSLVGGPAVRTTLTALTALVLVARRRWWDAAVLVILVGGVGLLNTLVKKAVARRRPPRAGTDGYSFPSGHASGSVALLGAASYLIWRSTGERAKALAVVLCGVPLAALIGRSRVVLHKHHLGDVLGGYILGTAWLIVTLKGCTAIWRRIQSG